MKMDFVDEKLDLISPERQRWDFESEIGRKIKVWGLNLLTRLNNIWKSRRANKKVDLVLRVSEEEGAQSRISNLSRPEQQTINNALRKIAEGSSKLDDNVFLNIANDLITAYEKGRLKKLIDELD